MAFYTGPKSCTSDCTWIICTYIYTYYKSIPSMYWSWVDVLVNFVFLPLFLHNSITIQFNLICVMYNILTRSVDWNVFFFFICVYFIYADISVNFKIQDDISWWIYVVFKKCTEVVHECNIWVWPPVLTKRNSFKKQGMSSTANAAESWWVGVYPQVGENVTCLSTDLGLHW